MVENRSSSFMAIRLIRLINLMRLALLFLTVKFLTVKGSSFYVDSALDFLKEYGTQMKLIGPFFGGKEDLFSLPLNETIFHFLSRNYSDYRNWVAHHNIPNEMAHNYYRDDVPPALSAYNDIYRYGNDSKDRFLSIDIADVTKEVIFSGFENDIADDQYICDFNHPSKASSDVRISKGFKNAINQNTMHNTIACTVPAELWTELEKSPYTDLQLNFVSKSRNRPILSNIRLNRPHELDRRHFNVSLCTIADDFNDAFLIEWIMYHILIGVEHFYLFDISKRDWTVHNSKIEPFLKANIVTIIYFPFVPLKDHDNPFPASFQHGVHGIHMASLNIALARFGKYSTYIGFQDIDELFVPSQKMLEKVKHRSSGSLIMNVFDVMGCSNAKVPGVMFDTLEMGCNDSENFYHSKFKARSTVTTHCTISGFLFLEMKHSHGKMFIKPSVVNFLPSPHRLNHYEVVWGGHDDGLFFHFNQFRYSDTYSKGRAVNENLKELTLSLLKKHALVAR